MKIQMIATVRDVLRLCRSARILQELMRSQTPAAMSGRISNMKKGEYATLRRSLNEVAEFVLEMQNMPATLDISDATRETP